ncbi:MAG: ATP-binding domain-containing protein [Bacteroidales bacterium]
MTIHKKIYMATTGPDGHIKLIISPNKHSNTLFFVDEASMIPDATQANDFSMFSRNNLLEDLIDYTFEGKNNKLILIGDVAQLPPVGLEVSPALDAEFLQRNYQLSLKSYELQEVVRQSLESGILTNATSIRLNLDYNGMLPFVQTNDFSDVFLINGEILEETLMTTFHGDDLSNSVIITRSNKRANIFNQEVRKRILFMENEISVGDYLMIVKNNYFWIDKKSNAGFLANGDMIEILRIGRMQEIYGRRFIEAGIRLIDYPEENDLTVNLMLDTLTLDGPSLSEKENQQFFEELLRDYEHVPSRRKRIEQVKNNPYFNALQVKFSYSLTCHKTQGGQWENVFIDLGYINEEHLNTSFYRWLYTAFTRATKNLYLINFPEGFIKKT